jgi:hypothetical protein
MNRVTERCDLLVQKVNMGKLHGQEAAMMVTDPPREGLLQQWELAPHPTLGERCHRRRVCLAGNERLSGNKAFITEVFRSYAWRG